MKDRFTRKSSVERNRIRKSKRQAVYERDNFTCQFCGNALPSEKLTIDHIIPLSKGGVDEITNYVTACFECNQKKVDMPMGDFAKVIAIEIEDLPVTGDPVIDNSSLPIEIRLLRKKVYDKGREGSVNIRGRSFQKKVEKQYRREFWATEQGQELEEEFPNLPGQVRIMIPEIKTIAKTSKEARLLIELAKSAKTRNLIGNLLKEGVDIEKVLIDYQNKCRDEGMVKKINQALKRLSKALKI